ncbi:putative toxin-antitoxin system toxin component, PIN family [Candidatus Binatus sp.]|uniref:putative toxin-antitoxin system toxin component, PIN family n=1 Tax=Candidatus Binatus sp. TaxID=2811406 RepID=UPI003BB21C44
MRVFLDTNVLASAFGTRGMCADLLQVILAQHELVTGEVVIEELCRVLIRKFDTRAVKVNDVERFLRGFHVEPRPRQLPNLNLSERSDLIVVGSAINAKAEILITGDREILILKTTPEGLRIVSPREFWNLTARITRRTR